MVQLLPTGHSLEGHTEEIAKLLLTPDGRLISSCSSFGSDDTTVKVWDIERGVLRHSLEGHTAGVSNLLLTPDGRLISSCGSSSDTTVKVWDVNRGELLHSLGGLTYSPSQVCLLHEPPFFITIGGQQLTVCRWDRDKPIAQFTTDGSILSCELASDDTIIVGDGSGRVHFLNLIKGFD